MRINVVLKKTIVFFFPAKSCNKEGKTTLGNTVLIVASILLYDHTQISIMDRRNWKQLY